MKSEITIIQSVKESETVIFSTKIQCVTIQELAWHFANDVNLLGLQLEVYLQNMVLCFTPDIEAINPYGDLELGKLKVCFDKATNEIRKMYEDIINNNAKTVYISPYVNFERILK